MDLKCHSSYVNFYPSAFQWCSWRGWCRAARFVCQTRRYRTGVVRYCGGVGGGGGGMTGWYIPKRDEASERGERGWLNRCCAVLAVGCWMQYWSVGWSSGRHVSRLFVILLMFYHSVVRFSVQYRRRHLFYQRSTSFLSFFRSLFLFFYISPTRYLFIF